MKIRLATFAVGTMLLLLTLLLSLTLLWVQFPETAHKASSQLENGKLSGFVEWLI